MTVTITKTFSDRIRSLRYTIQEFDWKAECGQLNL